MTTLELTAPPVKISFTVNGSPKGQPRTRACVRGKHAAMYDPGTANGWKALVAHAAKPHLPEQPINEPIAVTICFVFQRPLSHFRTNGEVKASAPKLHTSKPDCDNAAKAVLDILSDIGMWRDDAVVCDLIVRKRWADTAVCGAVIEITTAGGVG